MKNLYLIAMACIACAQVNAQNLVFRTKFDNGQAQDISGNGYHGVLTGTTPASGMAGIANSAIRFNGAGDYVKIAANTDFNLGKWTMRALIKMDGFYPDLCQGNAIIWHGNHYTNDHFSMAIYDNYYDNDFYIDSDKEAFGLGASGASSTPDFISPWYANNGFLDTGRWYCVVGMYDGTNMSLYIDGVLMETGIWQNASNFAGIKPTYIGGNPDAPSYPYWFKGSMDEITIWDDVLRLGPGGILCDTSYLYPSSVAGMVKNNDVIIYPTPAGNDINIEIPAGLTGSRIVIANSLGQIVMNSIADKTVNNINVQSLNAGLYIIKVEKGDESVVKKFIKH